MGDALANLRGNKLALYGGAGFLGGATGALCAEIVAPPRSYPMIPGWRERLVFHAGLNTAILASVLVLALFLAADWHQRREIKTARWTKILLFGAAAGLLSGAAGNLMYTLADDGFFKFYVLRVATWALSGLLLGSILSQRVPNLGPARGATAGAVGGSVGCLGALLTWQVLPGSAEFVGRIVGFGLLGLALGLAMHVVESLFREASVEVEWAPYETTRIALGSQPVTVGGGEDHIFVRGLPAHVSSIAFNNGQIEHIETGNGKRTPLEDGSRLRIGGLNMVIHAAK